MVSEELPLKKITLNIFKNICYKKSYILLFLIMIFNTSVFANYEGKTPIVNTYNEHEFLAACRTGNIEAALYFHNNPEFNTSEPFKSGIENHSVVTGLYLAAQEGHVPIVELLCAQENDYTTTSGTPLHAASVGGHTECVKTLVKYRPADINKNTEMGQTALTLACHNGHVECVKTLVEEKDLEINKENKYGKNAFFIAFYKRYKDCVNALLQSNYLDINKRCTFSGETVLSTASRKAELDDVKFLVKLPNIDVNKEDINGVSPLLRATINENTNRHLYKNLHLCKKYKAIIKLLKKCGAKYNNNSAQQVEFLCESSL